MAQRIWPPLLLLVLVLTAVVGCASKSDDLIDYTVTGGFTGDGDGTDLHVAQDGTATRPTRDGGTQTAVLDAATVVDLRQKISDAQFATLEPQYSCNCNDDYVYNVSVEPDGTHYTVTVHATSQYPARLKTLIDTLKDIGQRPLSWH
jgi:hypothetical protein